MLDERDILRRLAELEKVHTRYQGPKGPQGDKGDAGPAGKEGKDSTELDTLREERNRFRNELNDFREQLHACGTSFDAQMRGMHRLAVAELTDVCKKRAEAFHAGRDEAVAAVN